MFSSTLEIVIGFWQFFIAIASTPDFDVPSEWESPMYYASVINLDIGLLRDIFPFLNDFRIFFICVAVGIPVMFTFIGIIFLNPLRVILWYVLGITSLLLITIGVVGIVFLSQGLIAIDPVAAGICLFVGVPLLIAVVILFFLRKPLLACGSHEVDAEEVETVDEKMERETESFPLISFILRLLTFLVAAGMAVVLLGVVRVNFGGEATQAEEAIQDFSLFMGIACCVVALIVLVWMLIGIPRCGREFQWKLMNFVTRHFTRVYLIAISIAFIPVGAAVFQMFNCNDFTCPPASRHIDEGSRFPYDRSTSNVSMADFCYPCELPPSNYHCPTKLRTELCQGATLSLLESDRSIHCDNLALFWAASLFVVICFMIGVPVLFQQMIFAVTAYLEEDFPIRIKEDAEEEEVWNLKVLASNNVARFLYQPFVPHLRYTRLYQLLQKLLIVFTSVFIIRADDSVAPVMIALVCALVIHVISAVWLIIRRPFIYSFENRLSVFMEVLLVLSAVVAICIMQSIEIPSWVLLVIIILNGVLPLVALVIGIALEWTQRKTREEEEAEEERARIEAKMQEEDDHAMAQKIADDERAQMEAEAQPPHLVPDENGDLMPAPDAVHIAEAMAGQHTHQDKNAMSMSKRPEEMTAKERREYEKELHREKRQKFLKAKEAVAKEQEEQQKKLEAEQENADMSINEAVMGRMNKFLMVGGIILFFAMALCVVGLLQFTDNRNTTFGDFEKSTATEFADYDTWGNFTANCCCFSGSGNGTDAIVEKWICSNGESKERLRGYRNEGSQAIISGLAIRSLCQATFNFGCRPEFDATRPKSIQFITMTCSTSPPGVSSSDLQRLW